jgi:ABC-type transport system involved in multi-copper enzyme maturation permease subunit
MFGPHFYYDLIRLARKPRNYYLRCGYLTALMIGWWYVYEGSQPLGGTINDYARLATNFTQALLAFQYALILLLAPIYLAGTIVEERESRTLELLYQTQLTDREILLGKFAARVVHLMFFELMSLPMLAIISLWGGISVEFLLLNLGFSLLLILVVGSLCLWVSVTASRYTEAMIVAYTLEFGLMYGGFPMAVIAAVWRGRRMALELPWLLPPAALLMLGGAWFFYYMALRHFRKMRSMSWMKRSEPPPRRLPRPERRRPKRRQSTGRPIPEDALLWKETERIRRLIDFPNQLAWLGLAFVVLLACAFALIQFLPRDPGWRDLGNMIRGIGVMLYLSVLGMVYLSLAFLATGSVAHERERNTLDFLLLLPIERWQILFVKWVAPWIRQRVWLMMLLGVPLIGMVSTMFPARAALLLLILPWPSLLLINTLGLFLSVICRRTVTANIVLVAILLVAFVLHLLAWSQFKLLMEGYIELFFGGELRGNLDESTRSHARWLIVGQQTLFLLLAILFARLAFWRFERQSTEVRSQAG